MPLRGYTSPIVGPPCSLADPGCGLTVSGGGPLLGQFPNPAGPFGSGFGGASGTGFPLAFPKFAPPAPPRVPTPGPVVRPPPVYTPPPVIRPPPTPPPPTATAPPTPPPGGTPPPPPPPTPVGEPPIDEPPYDSYNPDALKGDSKWSRFWKGLMGSFEGIDYLRLSRFLASADYGADLLFYSANLGPSAQEEAQLVQQQLIGGGLPYADPLATVSIDTSALPDITGLSDLAGQPTMQELTVSGARPRAVTAADISPALVPVPSPLYGTGLQPAFSLATAPHTVTRPATGTAPLTAPRVGIRPGLAPTDIVGLAALNPLLSPLILPKIAPAQSPVDQPQEATAPNANDCQAVGQKGKSKSKQKKKTRNVCYRGTYEELKSGLLKFKKEQIPCR